jgi:transcriptional regulator of NAD metabolism
LKNEHEVIGEINSILKAPKTQVVGKIERLYNKLMEIISKGTVKIVEKVVKQMI